MSNTKKISRRLKAFKVTLQVLVAMFKEKNILKISTKIPKTAYVHRCYYDERKDLLRFIIQDDSFDEVDLGQEIPELEDAIKITVINKEE